MRIGLVTSFWHARGGDTTAAFTGARALVAAGAEVVPFAMRHPDNAPSPWDAHFAPQRDTLGEVGLARARAAVGAIWSRSAARELRRFVADARPDVLWVHHVHRHLSPSVVTATSLPVVWTLHDHELVCANGLSWTQGEPCTACHGGRWWNAALRRCKRDDLVQSVWVGLEHTLHDAVGVTDHVDRFVTPSAFLRDAVVAGGLPSARVVTVPNPLEDPGPGGPGDGTWAFAGRLTEEKGIDDVLAAAGSVPGLVVIGAPAPTRPGVVALGALSRADTLARLARVSVVVVASRWPENQPYAVLEAQALGRAVVATRVGGVPELVDDGVDGLLVPPGDPAALALAVRSLLADPARARRLGDAARRRVVSTHAPDAWARRMLTLFTECRAADRRR